MPRDPSSTPPDGFPTEHRRITGEQRAVTQPLPKVRSGAAPAFRQPGPPPPPPVEHSTPPVPPPRAGTQAGPRPDREGANSREWEMGTVASPAQRRTAPPPPPRSTAPRFFPPQPRSILETGLTQTMVEELVLKALFFAGEMRGSELAQKIKLPSVIIDEVIEGLRKQKYIDLKGGAGLGVGKSNLIFTLTTFATELMRQILDRNRYNGPAPVRMEDWFEAVRAQTLKGSRITRPKMEDKFGDLVVKDYIYDGLGPAMNSGRSVFFYGPPGNGKTALCQCLIQCYEGDIYVPHALLVDDFIIRVFDPTLHMPRPEDPTREANDARWVRCARPLVVVGGELTLETLDLIYSPDVKFYEAPFQLKATNGMLLIDDFGRQKVSPKDLLNRWIVPLESEVDYLTLHTGKKLQVPFDVFTAFSTNLDPSDLVDDAFLRRVRYKLEVQPPDVEQFHQIFQIMCGKRGVPYDGQMVDYLLEKHYKPVRRQMAACHPRDLLEQVVDISHYYGHQPELRPDLIDHAAKNYFVKFKKESAPR